MPSWTTIRSWQSAEEDLGKPLDYIEAQPRWPSMGTLKPGLMMGRMNSVISLSPDPVSGGSFHCGSFCGECVEDSDFLDCFALFLWGRLLLTSFTLPSDRPSVKGHIPSLRGLSYFLSLFFVFVCVEHYWRQCCLRPNAARLWRQ